MEDHPCACLLCHAPEPESRWDRRDRTIARSIEEYGWHVMGVLGDEGGPGWAYSIGLWHSLRSPEVCVFGLKVDTMMELVNVLGSGIREGRPLEPGRARDDVIEGYEVVVRPVHPDWYLDHFGAGVDFQQGPPWPVAQMHWPDRSGRFPWQEDAEESCRALQPRLWLPKGE